MELEINKYIEKDINNEGNYYTKFSGYKSIKVSFIENESEEIKEEVERLIESIFDLMKK